MKRQLFRLLVIAIVLSGLSGTAAAFVCLDNGRRCITWQNGQVTVRLALGFASGPLQNGTFSFDENAVSAAFDWNAVGARVQFNPTVVSLINNPCGPAGPGHACSDTGPVGDNPVFFSSTVCGRGFGDILAQTTNCFDSARASMVNAPVFMNSAERWDAYDGPLNRNVTDIRRVLLHELGHVLGLLHPDDHRQNVVALMNRQVSNLDRLQPDDTNGLFAAYGSGEPGPNVSTGCSLAAHDRGTGPVALLPLALLVWRRRRRG